MSDFTKGPWSCDSSGVISDDGSYVLKPDGGCYVLGVDARLIAAAPTMRDALQAALGILEDARTLDDAQNAIPFLRDAMHVADGDGE